MNQKRDKPFFIACSCTSLIALRRSRKYYEDFPLEEIGLPPHREDDLDDIPEVGRK